MIGMWFTQITRCEMMSDRIANEELVYLDNFIWFKLPDHVNKYNCVYMTNENHYVTIEFLLK